MLIHTQVQCQHTLVDIGAGHFAQMILKNQQKRNYIEQKKLQKFLKSTMKTYTEVFLQFQTL